MPTVITRNANAPSIIIGDKAVAMILDDTRAA